VAAPVMSRPMVAVESDAYAIWCILARLNARRVVLDFGLPQPELARLIVAHHVFSSFNFFAALRPVLDIASWALLTVRFFPALAACAFDVAAAAVAVAWVEIFGARVLALAALRSVVHKSFCAFLTPEGSRRVGAFAFAVAAAVVVRALVHVFAARRPIVRIPSWAILTLQGSHRVGAFTFTVTAAVVVLALVHVFAALRSVVGIPSWAILTFHGIGRVRAFTFTVTAAIVFQAALFPFFSITN
jgi:energy-converting hydrogenase Eha subunit C